MILFTKISTFIPKRIIYSSSSSRRIWSILSSYQPSIYGRRKKWSPYHAISVFCISHRYDKQTGDSSSYFCLFSMCLHRLYCLVYVISICLQQHHLRFLITTGPWRISATTYADLHLTLFLIETWTANCNATTEASTIGRENRTKERRRNNWEEGERWGCNYWKTGVAWIVFHWSWVRVISCYDCTLSGIQIIIVCINLFGISYRYC